MSPGGDWWERLLSRQKEQQVQKHGCGEIVLKLSVFTMPGVGCRAVTMDELEVSKNQSPSLWNLPGVHLS